MSLKSFGHGLHPGLLVVALMLAGCSGDDGSQGVPGVSKGTILGRVTNAANSDAPIQGATITLSPALPGIQITTDADGMYTAELPVGTYELTVAAEDFEPVDHGVSVLAAVEQTFDFGLDPVSMVLIEIGGTPSDAVPGEQFSLTATARPMDGSTVTGFTWTQTNSAQASLVGADLDTVEITLGDRAEYKRVLTDYLPVQDRFEILAVDPYAFERAASVTFQCEVATTSGTYTQSVDVHAHLDFADWSTGLRNLPVGVPVLFGGAVQSAYQWQLSGPAASTATLMDADTRFPWFVPDAIGEYTITESTAAVSIALNAGEWWGAIEGQDANGLPQTICQTACHATIHTDKFADWSATGHAHIFTNMINEGGHYGPNCFACHTVGYHKDGFDSTSNYAGFLDEMFPGGQSHPDPDNWADVLANWPEQAAMANVQCDNCHGPTGPGSAHTLGDKRVSVSAGVCATCHGEPPRHARYQQWLGSGHANFEVAIGQTSGSCAKCHTAQGYLEWAQNGYDADFRGSSVDPNEAQPITCVVCHDPHNVGTRSGNENDVTLRLEGDTPELLGGFTAVGVGKGAQCIVCHNTRRGEADEVITSTPDRAPHGGAQSDVLLGYNAFFVTTGVRGPHSLIEDTCASCHVERTPPPADLSYNLSGTNHSFTATAEACTACHGGFDPGSLIANTDRALHDLELLYVDALRAEIAMHVAAGREVEVSGSDLAGNPVTMVIGATSVVGEIHLTESHGRAAMDIDVDNGAGMIHVSHCRLNSDTTILDAAVPAGTLLNNGFSTNDEILAKSQWNYFLIHNDQSGGVHNPGWVTEILAATRAQLQAILP